MQARSNRVVTNSVFIVEVTIAGLFLQAVDFTETAQAEYTSARRRDWRDELRYSGGASCMESTWNESLMLRETTSSVKSRSSSERVS